MADNLTDKDNLTGKEPSKPEGEPPKRTFLARLKTWLPLFILLGGLALALSQGWHTYLSLDSLKTNIVWLDQNIAQNFLLVLGLFILIYAGATAFMVPASYLTIAGGVLFGLAFGTAATVIGATVGASILFTIARGTLGTALRRIVGPFIDRMRAGFNQDALSYMFALRLIPAFPFAVVNIAPALFGAKYRDYLITTFFGIMPGSLAYTWIGVAIGDTLRAGGAVNIQTLAQNFIPAFIALGVLALIPVAYKKIFKKSPKGLASEDTPS